MTSTAIYCRKSTLNDADDQAPGVKVQEDACRKFAVEQNLGSAAVYVDDGISGKAGVHRPGFERLKSDIEAGNVAAVICLTRLSEIPQPRSPKFPTRERSSL